MKAKGLEPLHVLLLMIVLVLMVSLGFLLFYNSQIARLERQIQSNNQAVLTNIADFRNTVDDELASLNANLSLEMQIMSFNIEQFRQNNEQELETLNALINEIEQQSNIQLDTLRGEISNLRVSSDDFSAIISSVIDSVVSVRTASGQGSGVVIEDDGFIVTNYHVVVDGSFIQVTNYDGDRFAAELIGFNTVVDVAVLKINADLPDLSFGNSDRVNVGQRVIALGNPAGLSFTVTEGIISAVKRTGPNGLQIYLQTDVPINPGNSGGPLVNINKEVIGLNNFKIGGFEGLGFAIESNVVEDVAEEIIDEYEAAQVSE